MSTTHFALPAQVVHPAKPLPPHCSYCFTAEHAPVPADVVGLTAVTSVLLAGALVVAAAELTAVLVVAAAELTTALVTEVAAGAPAVAVTALPAFPAMASVPPEITAGPGAT